MCMADTTYTFLRHGTRSRNPHEPDECCVAEVPDWSREHKAIFECAPSRSLIRSIRSYQRLAKSRRWWAVLPRKLAVLRQRCWSMVTGTDIPLSCRIGMRFVNASSQRGRHPDAGICKHCDLFQKVTV